MKGVRKRIEPWRRQPAARAAGPLPRGAGGVPTAGSAQKRMTASINLPGPRTAVSAWRLRALRANKKMGYEIDVRVLWVTPMALKRHGRAHVQDVH